MSTTENTTATTFLPEPPAGWYVDKWGYLQPELPPVPQDVQDTYRSSSLYERDRARQAEENLRSGGWSVADELDARCDSVHRLNQYVK
jgi:hypothetical protein